MRVDERLMNFGFVCGLVTVAIQVISFAIPGWLVLRVEGAGQDRKEIYAVWYIIICTFRYNSTRRDPCVTQSYLSLRSYLMRKRSEDGPASDPMNIGDHSPKFTFNTITQWEMEVTGGLVCAIVAAGVLFRLRQRNNGSAGGGEASAAAFAAAAVIAGLSCFAHVLSVARIGKAHDSLASIAHFTKTKTEVPYGLIVASMGTFLAFITTASIGIMLYKSGCRAHSHGVNRNSDQCLSHTVPMLPVQGQAMSQMGYASPLPPQYAGYQLPPEKQSLV